MSKKELTIDFVKKILEKYEASDDEQKEQIKTIVQYYLDSKEKERNKSEETAVPQEVIDNSKKEKSSIEIKQEQQLPERFSFGSIGTNHPQNIIKRNTSETVAPVDRLVNKNPVVATVSGPLGETVRQNSKGQYYYINSNGNAVIMGKNPAFNDLYVN